MSELSRTSVGSPADSVKTKAPPLTLHRDDLFHLLQSSRRRATLRYLFEHDDGKPVIMRHVAEAVAAREHDTTVRELSSDQRQRVYIALYQAHLPKLDEHGIIDYDQNRGAIELRELANVLRPYIEDGLDDSNEDMVGPTLNPPDETGILTKLSSLFGRP